MAIRLTVAFSLMLGIVVSTSLADPTTQPALEDAVSTTQPAQKPVAVLDPMISATVKEAVQSQTFQLSELKGGAFAKHPFADVSPDGVLIGFRIGLGSFFNNEVVKYIKPIYLTPRGEVFGKGFGNQSEVERTVTAKAPSGYAVGAVGIRGGGGLDAIALRYMRFNGTRLDPTDARVTPRIGGGGGGASLLDGDGTPIIGICGRQDDNGDYMGLGVIFIKPTIMVERR